MTATITLGLPDALRPEAASILWAAFDKQLGAALGDRERGVRFLAGIMDTSSVLWAEDDGRLVGVLVLKGLTMAVASDELAVLRSVYRWSMLPRLLLLAMLETKVPADGLLVDAVAIAPDVRGDGVGTRLIARARELAEEVGASVLELEVTDDNTQAKALYERLGFTDLRHDRVRWPLSSLVGSSGSTRMRLAVNGSA